MRESAGKRTEMKILWVKAGGLVPPDFGGRIRSYNILKELARSHEVTLFTFYGEQPYDPHAELNNVFSRVEYRPLRLPAPGSFSAAPLYARCLLSLRPFTIFKFCKPQVARDLRRLLKEERYDAIVCDFAIAGGVIPWDYPCPKVLFTHNVEAQIWRRHVQVARNPVWKAICWRECVTMSRAERAYLQLADKVLTVSHADRETFAKMIGAEKITVIPTGVDLDYFRATTGEENPNELVFTGSMDWLPNIDGVIYFVEEVLPLIRRQIPEVAFSIVGRLPTARVRELAQKTTGVRVTGRVEDVRPYMLAAAVYIVPLRVGGGTRLKIFEAMAMGKPIVSTSIGAEGLDLKNGVEILLADGAERFAETVVQLLRNPDARRKLGQAAAQKAAEFGWPRIAEHFAEALRSVVK